MSRSEDKPKITKLLLLEGLHGTGKSTLAASLSAQARTAVFHHGPPVSTDPYYEYLRPIVFLEGWQVICDRSHIGEKVWPEIFGRQTLFPTYDGTFRGVEDAIQEAASVAEIWYLTGSGTQERLGESTLKACLNRGLSPEQIMDAHGIYLEALGMTRFPVKFVSWSDVNREVERWKHLP